MSYRCLCLGVSGCFLLCCLGRACWWAIEAASGKKPQIACSEPIYHFGNKTRDAVIKHTFLIKNLGRERLEISRIRASCGCVVAEARDKLILPGQTLPVVLTLSLKNLKGRQDQQIIVQSNDPVRPLLMLAIQGIVEEKKTEQETGEERKQEKKEGG